MKHLPSNPIEDIRNALRSALRLVSPLRSLAVPLGVAVGISVIVGPAARGAGTAPDIEELFNADESKEGSSTSAVKPEQVPQAPSSNGQTSGQTNGRSTNVRVNRLSDLSGLSPFSDIAVIQKRFLPKTKRYEFFAGGSTILNDAFFLNMGLNLRLGYYFRERWGVEAVGSILTTVERDITKGLKNRQITTTSLVTPQNYFGLDLKWSPIYGKMTTISQKIIPFDLYFSLGLGATGTNQGTEAPTLHLGTGQIFALSKSFALRWDISYNTFPSSSGTAPGQGSAIYNNIFMTLGASFFFPEATYR